MKHVVSFYRFVAIEDPEALQTFLLDRFKRLGIVGTVLIAKEGVNATLSHGDRSVLEQAVALVESKLIAGALQAKYSTAHSDNEVFYRLKVKIRDEIIHFGHALSATSRVGTHVSASEWNELLDDPDVVVLDVRNDYEIATGAFKGSTPLGTQHFREFQDKMSASLDALKDSKVAMYCTGGIRCEKASNWLLEQGCDEVYQLDGGILGYLEEMDSESSEWQGECFVFDQRVSLTSDLEQGHYDQCHACRRAIGDEDKQSPKYVKSVSCPHCYHETDPEQKAQFAERAKQETLAVLRGSRHVGVSQTN